MTTAQPGQEQRMEPLAATDGDCDWCHQMSQRVWIGAYNVCRRCYDTHTRPTADLGEEPFDASAFAEHFRRKSKAAEDIGDATDFAEAADRVEELNDRLILYREALEAYVAAHDAWIKKDTGINAAIHAAEAVMKASNNARAVLSRSGG